MNEFVKKIIDGDETPSFTEWWDDSGPTERRGGNVPPLPTHRCGFFRVQGRLFVLACNREAGMLGGRVTWSAYPAATITETIIRERKIEIPEY